MRAGRLERAGGDGAPRSSRDEAEPGRSGRRRVARPPASDDPPSGPAAGELCAHRRGRARRVGAQERRTAGAARPLPGRPADVGARRARRCRHRRGARRRVDRGAARRRFTRCSDREAAPPWGDADVPRRLQARGARTRASSPSRSSCASSLARARARSRRSGSSWPSSRAGELPGDLRELWLASRRGTFEEAAHYAPVRGGRRRAGAEAANDARLSSRSSAGRSSCW